MMNTKKAAQPRAASTNSHPNYNTLENALIALGIWGILPFILVDWLISRGDKNHA